MMDGRWVDATPAGASQPRCTLTAPSRRAWQYVEVSRENKELKAKIDSLEKELADATRHAAGMREEADRSGTL